MTRFDIISDETETVYLDTWPESKKMFLYWNLVLSKLYQYNNEYGLIRFEISSRLTQMVTMSVLQGHLLFPATIYIEACSR